MILADTLKTLTTMGPTVLSQTLAFSGHKGSKFKTAKFMGMTNGGEFCYSVTFLDENTGEDDTRKVFVKYNSSEHQITAGF